MAIPPLIIKYITRSRLFQAPPPLRPQNGWRVYNDVWQDEKEIANCVFLPCDTICMAIESGCFENSVWKYYSNAHAVFLCLQRRRFWWGCGLTFRGFRGTMQKRNRLPERRTFWGAFYDHILLHRLLVNLWHSQLEYTAKESLSRHSQRIGRGSSFVL